MSTGKYNIVIVLPDLRHGGGQRVLLGLSRQFVSLGHQVEVVSLVADGELVKEIPEGVCYRAIQRSTIRGGFRLALVALLPLVRHLRETRPDAVLSSMTGTNLLTTIAHFCAGQPGRLVLREAVSLRNAVNPITRWLIGWLYRRAPVIVAVSAGVAEDMIRLGLDPNVVQVVYNPVDSARIRHLASQSEPGPQAFDRRPYVVSIGRLTIQKDQRTLIRAYAASRLRHSHRLLIVGEGEERPELIGLVRELQIEDSVELIGELTNPYPILARAALHVLSSRWEGYPNVLLEALALGIPVVATECHAGPRELLQDGRYGRLTPVGDHLALARAMDAQLKVPAPDAESAIAAHEPETVARRYLDLLAGKIAS